MEKKSTDLAIVDADNAANHFWDDDHVAEMGFYYGGLLIWGSLFLCFSEFLDETHWATLEAALEATPGAGVDELWG